ncbi:MAG TPA: ELM1/GtrOC1 family putative glycosyltransferase [Dongiaceae bacterium]|nr:ELM1/GtrOC1 family putative glycosyltransferase [Dongiaceae bacterium]
MSDRRNLPRVWALLSETPGDNAQVLALADALGWPFEIHRFKNRRGAMVANILLRATLPAMLEHVSGDFGPPWPDLVIAAGTPSEPICAQIRRAGRRAKHPIHQVFLGRPWVALEQYDLIVTTPQYWVPQAPNVMTIELPLHRARGADIAREAARWAPRIAHLPRPYVAVFLGGGISRYTLDSRASKRLALKASGLVAPTGGSLLICNSYRTPRRAMKVLAENLRVPRHIYDWHQKSSENPYLAFLGLADELIVTGDSMSMLAEACSTGKPVHIFDLGEGRYGMRGTPATPREAVVRHPWLMSALRARAKNIELKLVRAVLPARFHRETGNIHRQLVQAGRAVWLGDEFPPERAPVPPNGSRDVDEISARIRGRMTLG